jgi:hypothetical protein
MEGSNRNFGEEMMRGRIRPNTHKMYASKVEVLRKWLISEGKHDFLNRVDETITLPLTVDVLTEFMGFVSKKVDPVTKVHYDPPKFNSVAHVQGYRSAIIDLYKSRNLPAPELNKTKMSEFVSGYKRKIAQLKEDGELPMMEGKSPMSNTGYNFLALKALTQEEDFNVSTFSHFFLLLCWNLMARSVSVANIRYEHISWDVDALVINLGKTKGDQEGKNSFPRHVYGNPYNPEICPILGFALYLFCKGYQREGGCTLLFGYTAQERFSSWLQSSCIKYSESIIALGLIVKDIGTHSFRKGIATQLSNMPGGPSAISIWLRAGWSLGAVQSRYIYEGAGGDQFVGRAATGLDLNSQEFAVLPPHFNINDDTLLSVQEWEDILPGYSTYYPEQFRVAIPFLLASLVYHLDWLKTKLSPNHVLWMQRVYTSNVLEKLKSKVFVGIFANKVTNLKASGVPPYVILNHRLCELECNLVRIEGTIVKEIQSLPTSVCDEVLKHCSVNGAVPISADQVTTMMTNMQVQLLVNIRKEMQTFAVAAGLSVQSDHCEMQNRSTSEQQSNFQFWTWGGALHVVPESFRFPLCNTRTLWDLWWKGNIAARIGPYRHIKKRDLCVKTDVGYMSKGYFVIEQILKRCNTSTTRVSDLSTSETDKLFSEGFNNLTTVIFPDVSVERLHDRRVGDFGYIRMYDLCGKYGLTRKRLNVAGTTVDSSIVQEVDCDNEVRS